ncbi:excalibur calcium-binding domain-containing protein [Rhizobium sp. CFBP 8762]|uniref:excalibur calcium-binding domain-containing protein n=1 Tax=Rhizobium sp. CFBP 8762 TaxID=2775279 RepID=UPI00177EDCBC|nr:excalibur calcium-binding domain-containing protein [Rhizobium sp. CFBP 8762]
MLNIIFSAVIASSTPINQTELAQSYSCSPKKTCSKIRSCDEARYYLDQCPWGGALDRDKDGTPCESIC